MSPGFRPLEAAPRAAPAQRFADLTPAARVVWAKSGDAGGHGLLAHMLDVAAVAERLLQREPQTTVALIADALGAGFSSRMLAALAGLHDIGKASPGFQAKWPDGEAADRQAGLDFPARLRDAGAHDLTSALDLRKRLQRCAGDLARGLANAVAAHHGYVFTTREVGEARGFGGSASWERARSEMFDAYWATLAPAVSQGRADAPLGAVAWLAGLTSVADWIGSNVEWFPPGERDATLAGHHQQALALADRALDAIAWPCHRPLLRDAATTAQLLGRIIDRAGASPRPLQQAADELLRGIASPALLVVEAPMGEGKTELAFLVHLRLQAALGHRGCYIGLPTQATGNAMFERTLAFLRNCGHGERLDLQLAHGGALLDERLVELRGIHGEAGDAVRSSAWFSQRRRPLLSPYGVGTIDQALFATLNVKHHFVRLWGLANRVVVLDEVHAYDLYTGGLIEALLRWLRALGCSVIVMSATLPLKRRDALLEAWDASAADTPQLPYPRALLVAGGVVRGAHFDSRPLAPIDIQALDEDLESIAVHAAALLARGGCGAVIVNTVDRAQRLFERLRADPSIAPALMLFHARYPADERSERERAVLLAFGKTEARPERALLVATQVVEQSLDIDFDFLISDLAPIDLLLQRAGRLHRHERERPPPQAQPTLVVAGLMPQRLPELKKTGWSAVYPDTYVLGRSWAFASRESRWQLPQDIDRLVQTVYGDTPLPTGLAAEARDYIEGEAYGEHCANQKSEAQFARNAALDARAEPQNAYADKPRGREEGDGLGATNQTRLGEKTVTVVPVHVDDGRWRVAAGEDPFDPALKPPTDLARRLLARQVRLGRAAVVRALQAEETPAGFREHPWLKDVKPMRLIGGRLAIGRLEVRLDPTLGIVYGSTEECAQEDSR